MTDPYYFNQLILDNMETGVLLLDGRNKLLSANAAARRILGLNDDSISRHFDFLNEAQTERIRAGLQVFLERSGDLGKHNVTLTPKQVGADFTLIKLDEIDSAGTTEIRKAAEYLAVVHKIVSRMNHEIKNPLAGLYAGLHLLEQETTGDEQNGFIVRLLSDEAKAIDATINRVLDSTRYKSTDELKRIPVSSLLSAIAEDNEGVRLVGGPEDMSLWADETSLKRAVKTLFRALVDNRTGEISASVGWKRLGADVTYSVPGIFHGPAVVIFFEFCNATSEKPLWPFPPVQPDEISEKCLALYAARATIESHGGLVRTGIDPSGDHVFEILVPLKEPASCPDS